MWDANWYNSRESNIGGIGVEERVVLHSGLKANL